MNRNEHAWREIAIFCQVPFEQRPFRDSRIIRNRWQAGRLPTFCKGVIMHIKSIYSACKSACKRVLKSSAPAAATGTAVAVFSSSAMAAGIDVSAVTTGVSDAQTALLAVLAGLLALSTALFGLSKVYAFVKRKAGA